MFSVVVPLYNKARYVENAIQSVLDQTFEDFELIIINDGSTDNGPELLKQFRDPRIRMLNQQNAGVSVARNNGVGIAKYEYIAFLDADDWWDPEYLQRIERLIREYPNAAIWASKYYKVKSGKNIPANIGLDNDFHKGYINYFKVYAKTMWMPLYPPAVVISKSVFENENGFNPKLKLGEDFHLWARIAINQKIAYINLPLVYYNQDVDIHERAVGGLKIYPPENHFIYYLDDFEAQEKLNPDLKALLDKLRLNALFRYRLSGRYKEEMSVVLKSVDFTKQPLSWKLKYHAPLFMVRFWFKLRKAGSQIKRKLKAINQF